MTAGDGALSPVKAALLARWRAGDTSAEPAGGTGGPIPRRSEDGPAPLSLAQQRLWILEQFQPGSPAYNLFFCGRLGGRLDPAPLAAAVADLVDRHETLRSAITTVGGRPMQRTDAARPSLDVVDLRDTATGGAFDDTVATRMDTAIHEPFALQTGPLARLLLFRGPEYDCLGLVAHHLVADGWSLGVALRDLSECYLARAAGSEPRLDSLPVRFSDFAAWQREAVRDDGWDADLRYWSEQLRDLTPLELPLDRARPGVLSLAGDWCEVRLGRDTSDAIHDLARRSDTTPFTVLLAVYLTLLHRMSGQSDLTVGTAVAHRAQPQTYSLIGDFINMVALRTDTGGDPTFRELLTRAHRTCAAGFGHQDVPFERVVEELNPLRDTSRSAVFQTMLVMQPAGAPDRFAGLALELVELGSRTVRADLELHLWDRPEFVGRLAYSTDLFERATAEAMARRLTLLAGRLVVDPEQRLSAPSVLLPEEGPALRTASTGPASGEPYVPVYEQISAQARRRPSTRAIVDGDGRTLTFGELDRAVSRLARLLIALGVGPETRVGICLNRGADMVVAMLAVLTSGGAYVPLDPAYPAERLAYLVADSAAHVVITKRGLAASLLTDVTARLVLLDDPADTEPGGAAESVTAAPQSLAYVSYTSGSTGRPRGVQVEHRSLTNLAHALRRRPGLTAGDVVTAIASLSFDASVAEIFPPLAAGACVVVVGTDEARDGRRLAALIERHRVTVVQAVATTWRLIQGAGGVDGARVRALCGGEPISEELGTALGARYREAWNLYGPTEATVWTSCGPLTAGGPVSLGSPLDGVRLHLLDEHLALVPIGVYGELHIGGANLARGYLGRPDLTAERFVPDPFGPPGARLYRTGDRARRRRDGALEFAGRFDDQVKLRGYRIEPGEIEAELTAHPWVREAAVTVHPPDRLVGHVVLHPDAAMPSDPAELTAQLRAALRLRLAEYLVPPAFTYLNVLPTTPNGKLDRRSLPEPGQDRTSGRPYVAPRTDTEREVATFAADALGVQRVGVHDDFFALGGHSLTAAQLVAALTVRFGVDLSVQDLFVDPTVAHLAAVVQTELQRELHLTDEDERIRRLVAEMSEENVDTLTAHLLNTAGETPRP